MQLQDPKGQDGQSAGEMKQNNEIQQSSVIHERLFSDPFNIHVWLLEENQNEHLRFKLKLMKNKDVTKATHLH